MENSLSFNPTNGDSSSIISSFQERRGRDLQNLEQPHHHHLFTQSQVNLQSQTIKPTKDSDLIIPDPSPISAKSTIPTSRSISRSPPHTSIIINASSSSTPLIRYRECLKNHAASMGGLVVDGCGEFMPSGEEGSYESLKCAACECHRNFHRKEIDGVVSSSSAAANCYHNNNSQRNNNTSPLPPLPPRPVHRYPRGFSSSAPMMMNFGGGGGASAESSSEDLNMFSLNLQVQGSMERLKKRFRTKFSQEQKEEMMEFAEKLGWKIQKQDEQEVQQFCSKLGVKRKVFKVWMHNNKQAIKMKAM